MHARLAPLLLALALLPARADEEPKEVGKKPAAEKGPVHGGKLVKTATHRFEVVLTADQVKVWVSDLEGRPLRWGEAGGKADVALVRASKTAAARGNHQSTTVTFALVARDPKQGRLRDVLVASHALGGQDKQAVRIALRFTALEGAESVEAEVELTGTSPEVAWTCKECKKDAQDPGECPACAKKLVKKKVEKREEPEPGLDEQGEVEGMDAIRGRLRRRG